ncbi:plexin A3-like isoform X1 [Haliotis rufescens]|uniref:plexin A3-like isoform X1 n=2 Tax=Haliotis rufescens TaxID=6454 RepID=UPI001EAF9DE6|nr:plexin A3-like isoform X1 [Haliotis rufescens]XP_048257732.1 plexin A3-like isoform X1 [Haliotis rufescens]XP_048257733.1 plexin A3-like isoform X1 [Haliotis rufescens]XP_048257734.1 plexin A3-like isoform X1 [Haliotis rufescens]XP_048257735.1 plexin A3-like isoform X1 [Haliotis rufescens]XP_048257736.1 plexin A3-like isoform X1 [Haliotis rufescens]XP_048257737.1 plexin A3-like isoform X1 [Haliotis rufescens]
MSTKMGVKIAAMSLVLGLCGHLVCGMYLGRHLTHMAIDNETGIVYVGGVNRIYQLDSELTLMVEAETGPRNDSPNCAPPPDSCSYEKHETSNYNKILLIDRNRNKLVTCGSVYQGACETRNLINVSKVKEFYDGDQVTDYAVGANEPNASTVAFVAPGPPPTNHDVLYVGTTFTGRMREDRIYRDEVPAISSRSLRKDKFSLAAVTNALQGRSSSIYLKREISPVYRIKYVSGFSSGNFSYFLTVQRDSLDDNRMTKNVSKIIQLCQKDPNFFSYADVPLKCEHNGMDYNEIQTSTVIKPASELRDSLYLGEDDEILIGLFSRYNEDMDRTDAAICVYPMKDVRAKILENIKLCHQGNTSVSGGGYLRVGPRGNCNQQSGLVINNIEDDNEYLCNTLLESFSMVVGISPIVKAPLRTFQNTLLTAIAVTTVNEHTIAFIGTSDGYLKKVVLKSAERAHEYEEILVDANSAIAQDMAFDPKAEFIYVMTDTNVTRLKVQNCLRFGSCSDCLSDGDPYCGWCSLEKKCVLRSSCPNSEDPSMARWLHGRANQCIYITEISPKTVSVTKVEELHLTIPQLPMTSTYSCVFQQLNWSSKADFWYFGAKCMTPNFTDLGLSLGDKASQTVTLALNSSETGKLFVTRKFTFYNCSNFKTCSSCASSPFVCDWCIYENSCHHNTLQCQQGIIRSQASTLPGKRGAVHCPRIETKVTDNIYLPVGVRRKVLLKGYNFPRLGSTFGNYVCEVDTGSYTYKAAAERLDDTHITCDMPKIEYSQAQGKLEALMKVYWGSKFYLETTTPLIATVYKCDVLANFECGLCLNLNYTWAALECMWCDNTCKYSPNCNSRSVSSCPAPEITRVFPLSGPIQGGTNVTIEGSNLGSTFEDIENSVFIASVKCMPYRHLYSPSKRIVCRADWRGQVAEGYVTVKIGAAEAQYREATFHYQSPHLESIYPVNGPKAGGSRITISGRNLNTGGHIEASFGDAPCLVESSSVSESSLVCVTTGVWDATPRSPIKLFYDGREFPLSRDFFYRENPMIEKISPLKSIASGGRYLTVLGRHFRYIQKPQMFAYIPTENGEYFPTKNTDCFIHHGSLMKCPTPSLPRLVRNQVRLKRDAQQKAPLVVELGFIMDGVLSVRNLSGSGIDTQLEYYQDPQVYNFTEKDRTKIFKGEMLIIEGHHLTLAADKYDVVVLIGQQLCNVTTLSSNQIVCAPPPKQPPGINGDGKEDGREYPDVYVKVNNLSFHVGRVRYDVPEQYSFPKEAIAGIAASGGFLLLIIILILIIYRRQSTKAERIYRKLQIQLDNLESNVRNECKQAFAELQTDMTDLTGDIIASGIPFWDYHTYTFKVLFPGMSDHVILHPPLQKNGRIKFSDQGLVLFQQLLSKKVFLLTFIRTMEDQRGFSIRDKVNVASLLMIIYQGNMEYATEILKCLLVELVEKSVSGRHPKLMLRRTESVVEKLLSNWMSLCLYKYLKDHAGSPLFMLYKAIKLQAEKGPVDYVTGDARYSLSEDKLLREKIEPKVMTLNVEHNGEISQCRVLDCDTVTQAKEKMLDMLCRNVPFSQRPSVQDLDLEWRNGPTGPVLLQDEESTTPCKDGWRRYNMLSYYKVTDGAYMSLLHRQQTIKSLNGSLDNTVMSVNSAFPIMKMDNDPGTRHWHLAKHDDATQKDGGVKMISEIFLTRLLSTKGTLQKYIDDLFKAMLSTNHTMPPIIKYLFDFLDQSAGHYGLTDPDVVHTWKCNSLPLRFWVNIVKNPDFVFDINKPHIVDSCLSVVAQTFMDSCSTSEHRLGKDSPSNKLLFAKDIVHYRKSVEKYFQDIRDQPAVSDQDMNSFLAEVSRMCTGKFYISSALRELYSYVSKYHSEILNALDVDNQASAQQLSMRLEQVITNMEGPSNKTAYV